jgi:hypothetical protein
MDLWSPKLERIFHERFERRLRAEILNFMKGSRVEPGNIPFRHNLLMHFFNAERGLKAKYGISTVEQFASLDNKQLDDEMIGFLQTNMIVRIPSDLRFRLFFPKSGFFLYL